MEVNNEITLNIFKKELEKVVQIDALISETKNMMKPFQDRLKQLKFERKELEKDLCPTMEKNNFTIAQIPNSSIADCSIEYKVKQAMVPLTQLSIKEKMVLFFKEGPGSALSFNSKKANEKGLDIFTYIYAKQNRQFVRKEELKSKDIKI
jgi:hypothetical protein